MEDLQYLRSALAADADLCDRVLAAAQQSRDQLQLFVDLARFLSRPPPQANGTTDASDPGKKRKFEQDGDEEAEDGGFDASAAGAPLLGVPDVSFLIPARKKFQLQLFAAGLVASGKDGARYAVPWAAVALVFCLPVPEKTARQHNFVVVLERPVRGEAQFVFTLPEARYEGDCAAAVAGQDTWVSLVGRLVNTCLMQGGRQGIALPAEEEFASAIPQAHRKGEVGYHVKAHVGSKDGYLFFLATGILFGFRKPVQVFPLYQIQSISYTSVLQRTFNLVVTTASDEEVEFAMLDQADFAGIDAYVKRHGLNDASMAAERMAKRIGVNDPKRRKGEDGEPVEANGAADGEEEETELQKAERELQDAEDEEEEDYDPGSEGESEGEGSDSEGEGDGYHAAGAAGLEDDEVVAEEEEH